MAQRAQMVPLGPSRGAVLDRNGLSLTDARLCYRVAVYPGLVAPLSQAASSLAEALSLNRETLDHLLGSTDLPVFVADRLDAEAAGRVMSLGLEGVAVVPDEARYGEAALARHAVGYVQSGGVSGGGGGTPATAPLGADGLEQAWDEYLRGTGPDHLAFFVDGRGEPFRGLGWRKLFRGGGSSPWTTLPCDLVTTIDLDVQEVVEAVLDRRMTQGAVVVIEPRSGEVLAIASRPDFAPDRVAGYLDRPDSPLVNRAVAAYPPGSVFKPVVVAACLETGTVAVDEAFLCDASGTGIGGTSYCWARESGGHGRVTPAEALAHSCNDTLVQMGARLGSDQLAVWAGRFGFGRTTGLGLPGESEGSPARMSGSLEPEASFGQGSLEVTPVQIARFYATLANGGIRPGLRLADQLVAPIGARAVLGTGEDRERVISPFVASEVTAGLVQAVSGGTGQAAAVLPGVAGKTGTAETGRRDAAGRELYHGWFAGFWPTVAPRLVIVVLIEDTPVGGGEAAAIFGEILESLAVQKETTPGIGVQALPTS